MTGTTRRLSSSAATRGPPGRVDSPAHVDDVGPRFEEGEAVGDRGVRWGEAAAVRERIGGDVQHPHDQGALAEDTLLPAQGQACRSVGSTCCIPPRSPRRPEPASTAARGPTNIAGGVR